MKAKLFKDIRIAPYRQIDLFLAAELSCLAPGQFTRGQRGAAVVEATHAMCGKGLDCCRMANRTQTEATIELAYSKRRQAYRPLSVCETGKGARQVRFVDSFHQAERGDNGRLKPVTPRCPGQFGKALRIDITETRLLQGLPVEGILAEPLAASLPERGSGGRSERDGVAHGENSSSKVSRRVPSWLRGSS